MKNTIENTEYNQINFYAQYWGQNVMCNDKYVWRDMETLDTMLDIYNGKLKGWYAKLKPMSEITDNDAVEVAKIIFNITDDNYLSDVGGTIIWSLFEVGHPFPIHTKDVKEIDAISGKDIIRITDYLRSKGYALPYLSLTVSDLVEFGWVKLKQ